MLRTDVAGLAIASLDGRLEALGILAVRPQLGLRFTHARSPLVFCRVVALVSMKREFGSCLASLGIASRGSPREKDIAGQPRRRYRGKTGGIHLKTSDFRSIGPYLLALL
jgi:hypothetical protein